MKKWLFSFGLFPALTAIGQTGGFHIPYEKFQLDNGLTVLLHEDHSDPVVAVNLTVHVGSAREKEGRTGFAHLFEHLLFLESENLGKGGLDVLSANIGGSGANGSTSRDRTNYLQSIPKDALEKMLWAEADKLGWFINTVTDPVLAKEKQVVKNEKRQSYDNNPYGHTMYIHNTAMYPHDHPYNWQVIGSLEDLDNATLEDVKEFYKKWYVPNNVTLVIAGDFNPYQAKEWAKKYFSEIKASAPIEKMAKRPAALSQTHKFYHEDNFARLPELTYSWPTTEQFHKDAYALSILKDYLSSGKNAPLYKVVVEQEQLAGSVEMFNYDAELAGEMYLQVRAYSNTSLNDVATALEKGFALFEKEGIPLADLQRIKARHEVEFYQNLSDVLGKSEMLAEYQYLMDNPGFVSEDINNMLAVTPEDVMRVYEVYIKHKPFIATSFVPKGQLELILTGSEKATIVEEEIVEGAEEEFDASQQTSYEKTPSTFDRSVEPVYGEKIEIILPKIHENVLSNGIKVISIENDEVPLIEFEMLIDGGQRMEKIQGSANVLSELLMAGTANRTAAELETAIEQLGSSIQFSSNKEYFSISGISLSKNFKQTIDLLSEMLLSPRWDEEELELIRQNALSDLMQQMASANAQATLHYNHLIYGEKHVMAKNSLGTEESITALKMEDLKALFAHAFTPKNSFFNVVGNIDEKQLISTLASLETQWKGEKANVPTMKKVKAPAISNIFFYDIPDAKQSALRIGTPSLSIKSKDLYPAIIANYILGGGGFASRLFQELREVKGYTYGVRSGFSPRKDWGSFDISTSVRTNATMESLELINAILMDYSATFDEEDLATTKGYLIKSQARSFETAYEKLNMLEMIGYYGLAKDFINQRQVMVEKMSVKKVSKLAKKYMNPTRMSWIVVGDAATQKARIKPIGKGGIISLN